MTSGAKAVPLEEKLRRSIAASYAAGIRRFWAEQFVELGLGSLDAVRSALRALHSKGVVRIEVAIKCAEGHTIWSGGLVEFYENDSRAPISCRYCGGPDSGEGGIFWQYYPSELWKKELEGGSRKKKAAAAHVNRRAPLMSRSW